MADSNTQQAWGKLTSFNIKYPNINLIKPSYTIGRKGDCDCCIDDIRLSGLHCKIFQSPEGEIFIEDQSSNGTFIEDNKIGKGNKIKLNSGDKIFLLHKSKVKPEETIGYVFSATENNANALKKQREEEEKKLEEQRKESEKISKFQDELGEEMQCCICIDYIYKCSTVIPCLHNFCSACLSDWIAKSKECPNCRNEIVEIKKNNTVNNIINKYIENNPTKKRPQSEYEEMDKRNKLTDDRINLKDFDKKKSIGPSNSATLTASLASTGSTGSLFSTVHRAALPTTVSAGRGRGAATRARAPARGRGANRAARGARGARGRYNSLAHARNREEFEEEYRRLHRDEWDSDKHSLTTNDYENMEEEIRNLGLRFSDESDYEEDEDESDDELDEDEDSEEYYE